MEGNFSRHQLLEWANATFLLKMTQVEQCASGAVFVQILDYLFPNVVPMHKVKWNVHRDYEYIHNFKLLQFVFDKLKIPKHVEVDKLIKGKYQDNLEFFQWMKAFSDRQLGKGNQSRNIAYDPQERRRISGDIMPPWARTDSVTSSVGSGDYAKQAGRKNISFPSKNFKGSSFNNPSDANGRKDHSGFVVTPRKIVPFSKTKVAEIPLSGTLHDETSVERSACGTAATFTPLFPYQKQQGPSLLGTALFAPNQEFVAPTVTPIKRLENDEHAHTIERKFEDIKVSSMSLSNPLTEVSSKSFFAAELDPEKNIHFAAEAKSETIIALEGMIENLKQELDYEKLQHEKSNSLLENYKEEAMQFDLMTKNYLEGKQEQETILLEKEFYYNKLRRLEIMCEDENAMVPASDILTVLYATEPILTGTTAESETKSESSVKSDPDMTEQTNE